MKYSKTLMRWIMGLLAFTFLLSTFLMYDSGSRSRSRSSSSGQMTDYAVAEVNGKRLMRSVLEERTRLYLENLNNRGIASTDLPYVYQTILEQYAMEQQMEKEVRDTGIAIDDATVDQAMKEYADSVFPTREAFYQGLDRSGIKLADFKKDIARQMANQQLLDTSIGVVTVSEDEAVQFYDNTKTLFFRQPAGFMVDLAHFGSEGDAEKFRSSLLEGHAWNELSSGDAIASLDVTNVTTTPILIPEYTFDGYLEPMKSIDIGAVSTVFEAASNDFVLGVKNVAVAEKITAYDEVSADIRAMLQQQKEREALDAFSQGLLSRAKIDILDGSLFASYNSEVLPVADTNAAPAASAEPQVQEKSESSPTFVSTDVASGD